MAEGRAAVDRVAEGEGSSLNLDAVRASLGEAASLLAQVGEAARRAPDTAPERDTRAAAAS
jgi:hypothetical protein